MRPIFLEALWDMVRQVGLGIESGQNRAFLMAIVAMVFVIAMS